jgi:DNA glycosylase AlkZ-like
MLARHFLAAPTTHTADCVESVAANLVGLHSSDPATVYLSAQQRIAGFTVGDLDDALYERRSLARILGMRRTMFVVPLDLAAVVDAACTRSLITPERRRTLQLLAGEGISDPETALAEAMAATLKAIEAAREPLAARSLTPAVPELQVQISLAEGKAYAARPNITNRVLLSLSIEGHISRARPLGSWLSSQYRWAPWLRWFGAPLPETPPEEARAELVRRWLRTYGPGTTTDLAWWTKWTKRDTVAALTAVGAVGVTAETALEAPPVSAWVLADDLDDTVLPVDAPCVNLLPSLDPASMGWKERDWILDGLGPQLFDNNGNAGPIVLVDGAAVGAWAQVDGGRVVTELLTPVAAVTKRRIRGHAEQLSGWFEGVRVTPRFPAPLQTRLATGAG